MSTVDVRIRFVDGTHLTQTYQGMRSSCTSSYSGAAEALGRKLFGTQFAGCEFVCTLEPRAGQLWRIRAAEDSLLQAYPHGSIATREQAAAALEAARARAYEVGRTYTTESASCANVVFVARCKDQARDKYRTAMREVDRVQREARELTSRLDAEERAQEREKDEARRAADPLQRKRTRVPSA